MQWIRSSPLASDLGQTIRQTPPNAVGLSRVLQTAILVLYQLDHSQHVRDYAIQQKTYLGLMAEPVVRKAIGELCRHIESWNRMVSLMYRQRQLWAKNRSRNRATKTPSLAIMK
jgi:hypothetical protein